MKEFWIFSQAKLFVNIIWYSGISFFDQRQKCPQAKVFQKPGRKTESSCYASDYILVLHFCIWSPWCLGRYIWQDLPWPRVHIHSVPALLKKVILEKVPSFGNKLELGGGLCTPATCMLVREPVKEDSFMPLSCRSRCSLQGMNRGSLA